MSDGAGTDEEKEPLTREWCVTCGKFKAACCGDLTNGFWCRDCCPHPYDPEFGTSDNANFVRTAITGVRDKLAKPLPNELRNIVEIALEGPKKGKLHGLTLTTNELRVVRFALNRALESL